MNAPIHLAFVSDELLKVPFLTGDGLVRVVVKRPHRDGMHIRGMHYTPVEETKDGSVYALIPEHAAIAFQADLWFRAQGRGSVIVPEI